MGLFSFLLQVNVALLVFYSFYRLFLQKETFFMWNRVYLMTAVCFSFALPILRFEWLNRSSVSQEMELKIADILVTETGTPNTSVDWMQLATILYFVGLALATLLLTYKLWILRTKLSSPLKGTAFSFFRFKRVDPNLSDFETINRHEEVHIQQFHSVDILLMELAGLVVWFNPVIYLYKSSIKSIHEYLADEAAAEFEGSKRNYALLLLSKALGVNPELTNSFVRQSEVKKRILMLQKERSDQRSLWKYLWLIPLLSTLLLLSSAVNGSKTIGDNGAENGLTAEANGLNRNVNDTYGATFPGGLNNFITYLKEATKYPEKDLKKGLEGKVVVTFVIDKDGSVTDAAVKESVSPDIDKEALRVIRNSPKWIPGKGNGAPVRIRYDIGVDFKHKK